MSALTNVYKTQAAASLRALTLALIPSLSWRHHGIGVLQGYVSEDVEPEVRIHIWQSDLIKSGMDRSGAIHDHRFDLTSHVIYGTLAHEEQFAEEDPTGDHAMLRLTHARAAADTKFHGPTEPLPGRFFVRTNVVMIGAGYSYTFPAGHFHKTTPLGLVVSVVEKHAQKPISARILHPIDESPTMAFGHEMDYALVRKIIEAAVDVLSRAV